MIWFLGDAAIRDAVRKLAGDEELVDSSVDNAVPAHVWTEQIHAARGQKWSKPDAPPVTAVVYLPQEDYDSELTLWHVLAKMPKGSKALFVITSETSANVLEGLTHGDASSVSVITLEELSK